MSDDTDNERWKECDNCLNQVPYPRALCPVCEVTGRDLKPDPPAEEEA